jgi:uncharacterized membrane protein HdeD (DUF308 family)
MAHPGLRSETNWWWVLAFGISFVVLGVGALAFSMFTTLTSVCVFGWILAFDGIFEAALAFRLPQSSGFLLDLLTAIFYVVVGC